MPHSIEDIDKRIKERERLRDEAERFWQDADLEREAVRHYGNASANRKKLTDQLKESVRVWTKEWDKHNDVVNALRAYRLTMRAKEG